MSNFLPLPVLERGKIIGASIMPRTSNENVKACEKLLGAFSLQDTLYEKPLKDAILGARTFLLIFTANCHR
jgi:hypothetical protein